MEKRDFKVKKTNLEVIKRCRELRKKGFSYKNIAKMTSICQRTVFKYVQDIPLSDEIQRKIRGEAYRKVVDDAKIKQCRELRKQGFTFKEIAEITQVGIHVVQYYARDVPLSDEIKEQMKRKHKKKLSEAHKGKPSSLKGKTFEEIMGVEEAKERKEHLGNYVKNHPPDELARENMRRANSLRTKGKTYKEMYGEEKTKEIIEKKSNSAKLLWKNPSYKEGVERNPTSYPDEWREALREIIRKRDNYICRLGGEKQEELSSPFKKLDVHHIDGNKKNCNPDNLISLCKKCHQKVHSGSFEYFKEYFKKLANPMKFQKVPQLQEFRCLGKNKRNRDCNQLLFKYIKTENEVIIEVKCPSCNTFNILHVPFNNENKDKKGRKTD